MFVVVFIFLFVFVFVLVFAFVFVFSFVFVFIFGLCLTTALTYVVFTVRVASPATAKRHRRMVDAEAATIVPAPTFDLAENDTTAAEEEGAKPLIIIPYTGDTTPFPTAQGSSSVTDASKDDVILPK